MDEYGQIHGAKSQSFLHLFRYKPASKFKLVNTNISFVYNFFNNLGNFLDPYHLSHNSPSQRSISFHIISPSTITLQRYKLYQNFKLVKPNKILPRNSFGKYLESLVVKFTTLHRAPRILIFYSPGYAFLTNSRHHNLFTLHLKSSRKFPDQCLAHSWISQFHILEHNLSKSQYFVTTCSIYALSSLQSHSSHSFNCPFLKCSKAERSIHNLINSFQSIDNQKITTILNCYHTLPLTTCRHHDSKRGLMSCLLSPRHQFRNTTTLMLTSIALSSNQGFCKYKSVISTSYPRVHNFPFLLQWSVYTTDLCKLMFVLTGPRHTLQCTPTLPKGSFQTRCTVITRKFTLCRDGFLLHVVPRPLPHSVLTLPHVQLVLHDTQGSADTFCRTVHCISWIDIKLPPRNRSCSLNMSNFWVDSFIQSRLYVHSLLIYVYVCPAHPPGTHTLDSTVSCITLHICCLGSNVAPRILYITLRNTEIWVLRLVQLHIYAVSLLHCTTHTPLSICCVVQILLPRNRLCTLLHSWPIRVVARLSPHSALPSRYPSLGGLRPVAGLPLGGYEPSYGPFLHGFPSVPAYVLSISPAPPPDLPPTPSAPPHHLSRSASPVGTGIPTSLYQYPPRNRRLPKS